MTAASATDSRAAELAERLAAVRQRLARACTDAGRAPDDVRLVVVTKTWPAVDVRRLAALGVTDVGENRDQEARDKAAGCADLLLRWHFVGQLQSNKARSVARYADVVHSLDRRRLVPALAAGAAAAQRELRVLLQVALSTEAGEIGPRGGAAPADLTALADEVAGADGLVLGGLMAVGPRAEEPARAYARLAELAARLRRDHPGATDVSAGTSGDLEAAIGAGATHVRVGTAVLGSRPPLR